MNTLEPRELSKNLFISYSHDSEKHKNAVLSICNKLRDHGIDSNIDQYEDAPDEGWPIWTMKQIKQADFVLIICTEKYFLKINGEDEKGKGVKFEGAIITQTIYEEQGKNKKFIPVLMSSSDSPFIPLFLRSTTIYDLEKDDGYSDLYLRIIGKKKIVKNPVGPIKLPITETSHPQTEEKKDGKEPNHSNNIITYSKIESHYKDNESIISTLLDALEKNIIFGRDKEKIPVYLTKWRIKSIESMFLKARRKREAIKRVEDITDFGGMRIICLFEQDIIEVHKYLMERVLKGKFALTVLKIYNWDDQKYAKRLEQLAKNNFKNVQYINKNKGSGYKSIHYIVKTKFGMDELTTYSLEIQLRTLFQDIWGELEHTIAYKRGNIKPHLQKSFHLLSKDLINADIFISNLRSQVDKDIILERIALEKKGPRSPLKYESHLLPNAFKEDITLSGAYKDYENFMFDFNNQTNKSYLANKGLELYEIIKTLFNNNKKISHDNNIKYWLGMEEAFFSFLSGNLKNSIKKYQVIIEEYPDCYVPHFRIGEIFFIESDIQMALVSFDRAEENLSKFPNFSKTNAFKLKIWLANMYWLMGKDYYNISLEKVKEAESIYLSDKDQFSEMKNVEMHLANNLCWYYIEKFILDKDKEEDEKKEPDLNNLVDLSYKEALKRYNNLKKFMELEEATADIFDTAAWFCYQSYRCNDDYSFLEKAHNFCKISLEKEIYSSHLITTQDLHKSHVQEIMTAWQNYKFSH